MKYKSHNTENLWKLAEIGCLAVRNVSQFAMTLGDELIANCEVYLYWVSNCFITLLGSISDILSSVWVMVLHASVAKISKNQA